jgi:transposase
MKEQKQVILKKLALSPMSLRQFAIQEGIGFSTLHAWNAQFQGYLDNGPSATNPEKWSPEEKFTVVLETTSFTEVEPNEYCRAKGLYPEQVTVWKLSCIHGNMTNNEQKRQTESDARADKKRIKELERELRRKDKASGL